MIFISRKILYGYLLHDAEYYLKSWLSLSLSKKNYFLYGTRRFITVFTKTLEYFEGC